MVWVIFNVVFLIFVAILMILNGGNSAAFNFFGIIKSQEVSTVVILIIGFICGVLYSFLMYIISHFKKLNWTIFRRKKEKVKKKESDVKEKEKAVNEMEKQLKEEKKSLKEQEKFALPDDGMDTMEEIPAPKKTAGKKKQ
ncbi:MAG: hypothetical protein JW874_02175 [Spirochaetales bacterium]|nr:hypothetical protein [Spirochaetales bacterium]